MDLSQLGKQVCTQAIDYLVNRFIAMKKHRLLLTGHIALWALKLQCIMASHEGYRSPPLPLAYPAVFMIVAAEVQEMGCWILLSGWNVLLLNWAVLQCEWPHGWTFFHTYKSVSLSVQCGCPFQTRPLCQWFCPPTPNCCWSMKCSASKHDLLTTNWAFLFVFPVLSLILLWKAAAGVKTQQL
jgi:hypothetical protein